MQHLAITGIPGSGKTTLAHALGEAFGWAVVGTGDIARSVDPAGLAVGGMADEVRFRVGWYQHLAQVGLSRPIIFDGVPRSKGQLELLPPDTRVFLLTVARDIAKERLLRRGRSDDTPDIIDKRISSQARLLEVEMATGWVWRAVGYRGAVNTSRKSAREVYEGVLAYLTGAKPDPF